MKELRNKLKDELEGLVRKITNLNLLESIEYFYYSKNYLGKKKRKRIKKESEKLKNLFRELYIKLENIIRKKNKMILGNINMNKMIGFPLFFI